MSPTDSLAYEGVTGQSADIYRVIIALSHESLVLILKAELVSILLAVCVLRDWARIRSTMIYELCTQTLQPRAVSVNSVQ